MKNEEGGLQWERAHQGKGRAYEESRWPGGAGEWPAH